LPTNNTTKLQIKNTEKDLYKLNFENNSLESRHSIDEDQEKQNKHRSNTDEKLIET